MLLLILALKRQPLGCLLSQMLLPNAALQVIIYQLHGHFQMEPLAPRWYPLGSL